MGIKDRTKVLSNRLNAFVRRAPELFPDSAREQVVISLSRLRKVRSVSDALAAVEAEIERLLAVIMPLFVEHPLPIRRSSSARLVVGSAAMMAAAAEELEGLGVLVSGGAALPPSMALAITGAFASLALEAYVAASLRIHDLRRHGLPVSHEAIAADVAEAMAGVGASRALGRLTRKRMVKRIARRLIRRETTGLIPVIGMMYGAWDAQATISAIRRMPMPDATHVWSQIRLALPPGPDDS